MNPSLEVSPSSKKDGRLASGRRTVRSWRSKVDTQAHTHIASPSDKERRVIIACTFPAFSPPASSSSSFPSSSSCDRRLIECEDCILHPETRSKKEGDSQSESQFRFPAGIPFLSDVVCLLCRVFCCSFVTGVPVTSPSSPGVRVDRPEETITCPCFCSKGGY